MKSSAQKFVVLLTGAAVVISLLVQPASAAARKSKTVTSTTTTAPTTTSTTSTTTSTTSTTVAPTTTTTAPPATTTTTSAPTTTSTTAPAATRTLLSQCSDGSAVVDQMVTPENALIAVCTTVGGWTPNAVYTFLKPNALDLAAIGPRLTVQISTGQPSSTGSSASCCDASGLYYGYRAVMSLNPSSTSSFASAPEAVLTHEYGHAWTGYWRYTNPANNGSWSAYDHFRWATADGSQVLAQNAKLNTSYNWMDYEMAADDYRRLFGTTTAQSQLTFLNSGVPDSQSVAGLASWFLDTFR